MSGFLHRYFVFFSSEEGFLSFFFVRNKADLDGNYFIVIYKQFCILVSFFMLLSIAMLDYGGFRLKNELGNNVFAYQERNPDPKLWVPKLISA